LNTLNKACESPAILAPVPADLGELEQAEDYMEQALTIFEEIESPNAEQVRGQLAELEGE
jgi:hypothetical protein